MSANDGSSATAQGFESDPSEKLTQREHEILLLIADGYSTKEIAARLEITFKTVASHRSHIFEKLGVHNVVGLLHYAIRQRLIQP